MELPPTIPVEITHPSGLKFKVNLTCQEVERINTDADFYDHIVNKYYDMYNDGLVTAYIEEDVQVAYTNVQGQSGPNIESQPSTSTGTPRSNRPREWKGEDEEMLIQLVSARAPLWDFRLPLKNRGRNIIKNLWEEILLRLNVDMSVEAISRKWKSIRDSYIRARANINKKLASGSSAEEKVEAEKLKRNHRNYDLMMFLDNSLTTRRTSSNLKESCFVEEQVVSPSSTSRSPSSSRSQSVLSTQDEMFLDAIKNIPGPREVTPNPSQHFCLRLADGMDKLPPRIRNQLQLEFLQKLTEMENLYVYND